MNGIAEFKLDLSGFETGSLKVHIIGFYFILKINVNLI